MSANDNNYTAEAENRWGDTDAYKEMKEKTAGYSAEKWFEINSGLNDVLAEFAQALKSGAAPESDCAQMLVRKLQNYITENYYKCAPIILSALGQMFIADDRFRANIDQNGEGTAAFISEAIKIYCE